MLRRLSSDGFFSLPAFLSEIEVAALNAEMQRLLGIERLKHWADKLDCDHRIYGANGESQEIQRYYENSFINKIFDIYQKSSSKNGFTMAARMVFREGNTGSGDGWHRDSCEVMQTKTIAYLSDTGPSNGPFQYIKHSHSFFYILRDWLRYGIDPMESRVCAEKLDALIGREPDRLIEVTGKAGDTLFADTRGLHRGKPIEKDLRLAMTNYYWFDAQIPEHIKPYVQDSAMHGQEISSA